MSRYPLVVQAMGGLGDNIYLRPLVRAAASSREDVFLGTPWPELWSDVPVKLYPGGNYGLRTQSKNVARTSEWAQPPPRAQHVRPTYRLDRPLDSIVTELERHLPLGGAPYRLDLPDFGPPPVRYKRYAVVRPVTHRAEWFVPSRSPDPAYIRAASVWLRRNGYRVVVVADLEDGKEWLEEPAPVWDRAFLGGQLVVERLMALIQHASLVVGGVGWILPASVAARVPAVIIAGGCGGWNAPERVTDPRMDTSRVRWLMPDDYCRCKNRVHDCPKRISDFETRFAGAVLDELAHAA